MENIAVETLSVGSTAELTDETRKDEQPQETSLIKSLLLKETKELDDQNKKRKKKGKLFVRKNLERFS
jgi:hypothetical protein